MIDVKEFERLRSDVSRLQREADKAAGAHAEQMKQLKKEFGCETLEDAERLLRKLEREAAKAEAKYVDALDRFRSKWNKELGE